MTFADQKAALIAQAAKAVTSAQAEDAATGAALSAVTAQKAASAQALVDALALQTAAGTIAQDPITPPPPPPPVITVTPDGYAAAVTDSQGHVWSIIGAQLARDGVVNGATSTVTKLYAKAGQVFLGKPRGL